MNGTNVNCAELLMYIDPRALTYQEWLQVGMALNHEGCYASDWEQWSKRDTERYVPGECYKKWEGFHGSTEPVTKATIIKFAKDGGWKPERSDGTSLDWDAVISEERVIVDANWLEGKEIQEPERWDPIQQLITYISTLFESTENVGYVTDTYSQEGRFLPKKGSCDRSAGQLIQELNQCKGDLGAVIGDYNPRAGAWIRFNPLDGNGVKNENVTDFRYALVESDDMELDKQNAIIRELELPVACLVFSGKKSIHAIVKVDAADYGEYRKRVDYLYDICEKNGLRIDKQNRNPSRLSRMPGVMRDGRKQFLMDTNIGKSDWATWFDWIEGVNDDLPEPEQLSDVLDELPDLAPPLIHGVLRQGHKMLLAGPSKAGKSFALIQLCIAVAEGLSWFGWDCAQGNVLYVNLELDRASALHRFKDVYKALNCVPTNAKNIDIWNLRGKSLPMDKLAPKLIRRAQKKNYTAVIIDPIYKVITGDENSANEMAHFANQFDKVCTELGSAVIYCHHHSKGYQGQKRSMDRASGSGVFARDPDALLDLTELELTPSLLKKERNDAICRTICTVIGRYALAYLENKVSDSDTYSEERMKEHIKKALNDEQQNDCWNEIERTERKIALRTAWRIEGTLREFPQFEPVNSWFEYPRHNLDVTGVLADMDPEAEKAPWQKAMEKRKDPDERKKERVDSVEIAFAALEMEGEGTPITTADLAEEMGVSSRTVWRRINEHGGFETEKAEGMPSIVRRVKK